MPNYYEISAAHGTLALDQGKGSASFAVRYMGDRRVETRARAVPMEGADAGWLQLEPPDLRDMQPGQTQTFKVNVAVPPGTAPGRYGLRLDAVSVDNTDEEYGRGPLVTFQVEAAPEPEPDKGYPWWMIALAAVVLILVLGGLIWWFFSGSSSGRGSGGVVVVEQGEVELAATRRGEFQVDQTWSGDFDLGRQVPRGAPPGQADFWYQARTATDRVLVPKSGAALALVGRGDRPTVDEVKQALAHDRVDEIDIERLRPGVWAAAMTTEGHFVAFTTEAPVGPSPSPIALRYALWAGD